MLLDKDKSDKLYFRNFRARLISKLCDARRSIKYWEDRADALCEDIEKIEKVYGFKSTRNYYNFKRKRNYFSDNEIKRLATLDKSEISSIVKQRSLEFSITTKAMYNWLRRRKNSLNGNQINGI